MPGNFYYLKSNDDFIDQTVERDIIEEEVNEVDVTIENTGNDFRNSMIRDQSEYDENPSDLDYGDEGWKENVTQKEKSLIERYKTLELLMKKKKMMT